jgi:SAM-dependent methyltransferase
MAKRASSHGSRSRVAVVRDRHYLYSAAVQSPEADLGFFRRVWRKRYGGSFRLFREDFCGTAVMAHDWVRRGEDHRAWGIDLDSRTLRWARERYTPVLGAAASRLQLVHGDVLEARVPRVDVVAVLNFSYCVFKERQRLGRYFRQVRRGLRPGGLFFIDVWGGFDTLREETEKRRVSAETAFDKTRLPAFTYVWEQARFNPVDHHILCHIHFELRDGSRLRRAFSYDWRLWMLPELVELLGEAGFAGTEVYVEGWDEEANESDGIFRRKSYFENQEGWVAYLVAS